jgi:2-dehydro-3-deoxy-D-pentonate aldolase
MPNGLLRGVIPAMVTLFNNDYSIAWEDNEKLIKFLIKQNINGLFILGSAGEFDHLSTQERKEFAEFSIAKAEKKCPILVGVSHTATDIVIDLAKHAEEIGADYLVVVTPYYMALSEKALFEHYKKIALSVNTPIILYNCPPNTGKNMSVALISSLVDECENIVGIKDTLDSMDHVDCLINEIKIKKSNFSVLTGMDHCFLATLVAGGDGVIGGLLNFYPEIGVKIFEAYESKNYELAIKLQQEYNIINGIYKILTPPISVLKEAINLSTSLNISTTVRGPAIPMDALQKKELKNFLIKHKSL